MSDPQAAIGSVVRVTGTVFAEIGGQKRVLAEDSKIFEGETVVTASGSKVEIRFKDDTVLSQGENSRIELDEYVYAGEQGSAGLLFNMVEGTFRTVTGKIVEQNPEGFNLSSPLATIGIRGTKTFHSISRLSEKHGVQDIENPSLGGLDSPLHSMPSGFHTMIITYRTGEQRVLAESYLMVEMTPDGVGMVRLFTQDELRDYIDISTFTPEERRSISEQLLREYGEAAPSDPRSVPPDASGDESGGQPSQSSQPSQGEAADEQTQETTGEVGIPEDIIQLLAGLAPEVVTGQQDGGQDWVEPLREGILIEDILTRAVDAPPTNLVITLTGSAGNDTITGSSTPEQILGLAGDDVLFGRGGNDTIDGGLGYDELWGGAGDDLLIGGDDTSGSDGDYELHYGDDLYGEAGNDTLIGGMGWNYLDGGDGNDCLIGGQADAADSLYGGSDQLGGAGNDTLIGGNSGNYLDGGSGTDSLVGGMGWNEYIGYADGDTLDGRLGEDLVDYSGLESSLYIDLSAGYASLIDGSTQDSLVSIEHVWGSNAADTIIGNASNNEVWAGDGADSVLGGAGDDWLYGEAGNDSLLGGAGSDWIDGGAGNDFLSGEGGGNELYGYDGNDTLLGGTENDLLEGGAGQDCLDGGLGNDWLYGDLGDDTLLGGDGDDYLIAGVGSNYLDGGTGIDWVDYSFSNEGVNVWLPTENDWGFTDTNAASVADTLVGIENVVGSDYDDIIDGDNYANILYGGYGSDELDGYDGDDFIFGEDGDDVINGGYGNDVIDGGDGDDFLAGGGGNDTLVGGEGVDTFYFYPGCGEFVSTDVSAEEAGAAGVLISDFATGVDVIELSYAYSGYSFQYLDDQSYDGQNFGNGQYLVLDCSSDGTRRLIYDGDGPEGFGYEVLATFSPDTELQASDITIESGV